MKTLFTSQFLLILLFFLNAFTFIAQGGNDKNDIAYLQQVRKLNTIDSIKSSVTTLSKIIQQREGNREDTIALSARLYLARAYYFLDSNIASLIELNKVKAFVFKSGSEYDKFYYHDLYGRGLMSTGNYKEAIQIFLSALKLPLTKKIPSKEARLKMFLGECYGYYGNKERTLSFYFRSLEKFTELNDTLGMELLNANIASVYFENKQHDSAMYFLNKSHALTLKIGNIQRIAKNNIAFAEDNILRKNYRKAIQLLIEAKNDIFSMGYAQYNYQWYITLAKAYEGLQNYDSAKVHYLEAERIAAKGSLLRQEMLVFEALSKLEARIGNYKASNNYLFKHFELKDSLFQLEKAKTIDGLLIEYETKQKELENKLLKTEIDEKKNQLQLLGIAFLLGISVLIGGLLFIRNKSLREAKKALMLEVEAKAAKEKALERELAIIELTKLNKEEMARKEELEKELETLNSKLLSMLSIQTKKQELVGLLSATEDLGNKESIPQLLRELKNDLNNQNSWEEFKTMFERLHPSFFNKLAAQSDQLTASDFKLAAYLRLNLSTKEIANLFAVTEASLLNSRSRLRKKLNLNAETDLVWWINQC